MRHVPCILERLDLGSIVGELLHQKAIDESSAVKAVKS